MTLFISWGVSGILLTAALVYGKRVERFFERIGFWIGQRLF